MSRREDRNLRPPITTPIEDHRALSVSPRWLSVFWALVLVIALSFYVVDLGSYPSAVTLFPKVISLPTLGLAVAYFVKELVGLMRFRHRVSDLNGSANRSENQSRPLGEGLLIGNEASTDLQSQEKLEGETGSTRVKLTGLGLAVGLAVAYAVLFRVLGFALDSMALIVGGPLLIGQPLRRAPIFLAVGMILVIMLSVLVHLSGVFPLPTGAFHIGVS